MNHEPTKSQPQEKFDILETPAAVLMFLIIFLTFLQVCLRYVFNHSLAWIEEISRYLFIWIVFLGSVIAFKHNLHIRIDFIDQYLKGKSKSVIDHLVAVINVLAIGLLFYSGSLVAWRNRSASFYTAPDLPIWLMYVAVPLCCALMIIVIIRHVAKIKEQNPTRS